jgi:hypothetical protein
MSFMNDILSTATFGESDRLDATVWDLVALQARFDALVALLNSKGLLTAAELAAFTREAEGAVTNEELDRLDVKESNS